MARAAIDIGSNSVLLVVVDDEDRIVHDEARVVGLGKGLGDVGLFAPDRMRAAEAALADYVNVARRFGIEPHRIRAVATSAARRAHNAGTWLGRVQRTLGLRVEVISGDEEARLTRLGAMRDLELPPGPSLVVDLGGGSTELVLGESERLATRVSLEIGSVRLTEAFLGTGRVEPSALMRLRNHVDAELANVLLLPLPRVVVGVAGTATTLGAMALGLERYESSRVHGCQLTRSNLQTFADALLAADPDERRRLAAVSPERADYLLAGATILDRVLLTAQRQSMVVSDRGLRFGLLV